MALLRQDEPGSEHDVVAILLPARSVRCAVLRGSSGFDRHVFLYGDDGEREGRYTAPA